MTTDLDFRKIIYLTIIFIVFTVVGTLSHELGHISVARYFGFETRLSFAHMEWNDEGSSAFHQFWIAAGGPIQTMLFGTIGLLLLIKRKASIRLKGFQNIDWLLLFLGLFWSREIFNLSVRLGSYALGIDELPFGGDEAFLSESNGLYSGTFPIIFGILGLLICCYLTLVLLAKNERLNFFIATAFGFPSGYLIWMDWLGPMLLP